MKVAVKGFYVTGTGTLTLYSSNGAPRAYEANNKIAHPIVSFEPRLLDTTLDKVALKTSRTYYHGPDKLSKTNVKALDKMKIRTLRDLIEFYRADPATFTKRIDAARTNICLSGVQKIEAVLANLDQQLPDVLSADYEPVTYLPIMLTQIALPAEFPDVFNGAGVPPDVLERVRRVAEIELGKIIAPLILDTARQLEEEKIAKAQSRLEKLKKF